jgi:hypothetical protein
LGFALIRNGMACHVQLIPSWNRWQTLQAPVASPTRDC